MNAQRKTTAKSASAKTASAATMSAASAARSSAENVVNFSSKAVKDIQSSITSEAQKTQEKLVSMGRESAETFAKSADKASKSLHEIMNICRDNMEACMESGNISANICKELSQEVSEYCNQAAADQMEVAQQLFACRTLNDLVELQNKVVRGSLDNYFEQCHKISNLAFECVNEICEPINQRVSEATEQVSKMMTA
jgi:hypothetical protein